MNRHYKKGRDRPIARRMGDSRDWADRPEHQLGANMDTILLTPLQNLSCFGRHTAKFQKGTS
jgi:hypothetical protein